MARLHPLRPGPGPHRLQRGRLSHGVPGLEGRGCHRRDEDLPFQSGLADQSGLHAESGRGGDEAADGRLSGTSADGSQHFLRRAKAVILGLLEEGEAREIRVGKVDALEGLTGQFQFGTEE